MYPHEQTEQERLNKYIDEEAMETNELIRYYVNNHDTSHYEQGVRYYLHQNDEIMRRVIYQWDDDQEKMVPDPDATNNKVPSGWFKLLVDQKQSYLTGKEMALSSKSGNEQFIDLVHEILGEKFGDTMPELVKNSSIKSKEWLHSYIDEDGQFNYMIIPAEQYIPLYDDSKEQEQVGGIRYYPTMNDDVTKIEVYDKETVTYYEMIKGQVFLDVNAEVNPAPHFYFGNQGYGWGRVPFVEFKNNEEGVSDLAFVKKQIDLYDLLTNDAANTLQEIQDFAYIFKGDIPIDNTITQMVRGLKNKKGANVSGEGNIGIDTLQGDIPNQALNDYLERLVEDIYKNGQGVNNSPDKFGNAPSGVALKNLYSLLDMKCNVMERKFTWAIQEFMWFITEYLSMSGQGEYDPNDVEITFNKSMLMNEAEQIDNFLKSGGKISNKTALQNHPWVTDVEAEQEQIDEENEGMVDLDMQQGGDDLEESV